MDSIYLIIIIIVVLFFFIALFFIVDFVTKAGGSKKVESGKKVSNNAVKETSNKEAVESSKTANEQSAKPYMNEAGSAKQLYQSNLADDVQRLISNEKPVEKTKNETAASRSHLVNRGRMREYYEKKHAMRSTKYGNYGVASETSGDELSNNYENMGDLTLTQEEIKKLMALHAMLQRKDEE